MCARLIRILNAMHRDTTAIALRNSKKTPNPFRDDETFVHEFMEQRGPTSNTHSSSFQNCDEKYELLLLPDPRPDELMEALVRTEQFMRSSVNSLEILSAVEPDTRLFARPSQRALDWVRHALENAMRIEQTFIENDQLAISIMRQGVSLPPALAKFVALISMVLSTYHLHNKRCDNHWIWPDAATADYSQNWNDSCPYVDVIRELEEIRVLLEKQNASSDRLRNANFTSACTLVDEAFVVSSKVLAIRLDLGYAKGAHPVPACEKRNDNQSDKWIDLDTLLSHLKKFLDFMNKTYGLNRLANILKIEYGLHKGYHGHLLLLLNGHRHQQDVSIAQLLGKEWAIEITKGSGVYWNCNARKDLYRENAIGMINRKDENKRALLKSIVLTYLVKHDIPIEILKERSFRKFRPSHRKLK